MELPNKKSVIALVFGGGLIVGAVWGYFAGDYAAREEVRPVLDVAFPPPPKEITRLSGVIQGIEGDVLLLRASDPRDYLPHTDGSPRKEIVFRVKVAPETELVLRDYTKEGAGGGPLEFTVELSSLTPGHAALVESAGDIGNKESFIASRVQVTQGFSSAALSSGIPRQTMPSSLTVDTLKAFSR